MGLVAHEDNVTKREFFLVIAVLALLAWLMDLWGWARLPWPGAPPVDQQQKERRP